MRILRLLVVGLVLSMPSSALAQEPDRVPFVLDVAKRVIIDPTTYIPAIVAWKATRLDWDSSQVLFQHGLVESNPQFTASGRAGDIPITYSSGNRQIFRDALVNFEVSAISNVAGSIVERALVERYPAHRTLVRRLGWAERISLAALLSYKLSIQHFHQAQMNDQLAGQMGYTQ